MFNGVIRCSLILIYCAFIAQSQVAYSNQGLGGIKATQINIPSYDKNGRLSWELKASEVESLNGDQLLAKNPILAFYGKQKGGIARSGFGVFDLENGHAHGEDTMDITGKGLRASGNGWSFTESTEHGNHQLSLKNDAQVQIDDHFDVLFAGLDKPVRNTLEPTNSSSNSGEPSTNKSFPTRAHALNFELLSSEDGDYRLYFEGNVSVEMAGGAYLICEQAEIVISKERNSTASKDVQIDSIQALGSVHLLQPGRSVWADELNWESNQSTVSLLGNARVLDDTWGEAVGETILLEKGRGRVQVLGGEKNRSRISLPNIPNFSLPFKSTPEEP